MFWQDTFWQAAFWRDGFWDGMTAHRGGKGDNLGKRKRIFKPSGLVERPKRELELVKTQSEPVAGIYVPPVDKPVATKAKRKDRSPEIVAQIERDREIARLLGERIDEEETMLLLMMA